jgi:hypothetical protein
VERASRVPEIGLLYWSDEKIAGLHEAIQAGRFGRLKISYGYCCKPRDTIGLKAPTTPPGNLDWNLWLGTVSDRPFVPGVFHPGNWRKLIDFGKKAELPAPVLIRELVEWFLDDVLDELGTRKEVEYAFRILDEGSSAQRQLATYARTGDLRAVVDQLIRETAEGVCEPFLGPPLDAMDSREAAVPGSMPTPTAPFFFATWAASGNERESVGVSRYPSRRNCEWGHEAGWVTTCDRHYWFF